MSASPNSPQNLQRLQAMADEANAVFKKLTKIDGVNTKLIQENSERIQANLDALNDTPIVANAGLLKAGKSSLFNAISGQQEKFATGAARCTTVQQALAMNGFQLVDTPGLDANETDTAEAQSVFQKASLILFVHSQQNGELIQEEADFLTQLCTHFTNPEIRHQTIIPVLTKCEGVPSEELDKIEQSLRKQWQQILGQEPIQVFRTRTNSYFKGITENKPPLTKISEIPTLIDYITQRISDVSTYQQKLAEQRINDSIQTIQKHIHDVMKAKNAKRLEVHEKVAKEIKHLEKDAKLFTEQLQQEYKSLSL